MGIAFRDAQLWRLVTVATYLSTMAGCGGSDQSSTDGAAHEVLDSGQTVVDADTKQTVQDTAVDAAETQLADTTVDSHTPADGGDTRVDSLTDTLTGKLDGEPCAADVECESGNCRKGPAGDTHCAAAGALCANGSGGAMAAGASVCHGDDSHKCVSADTFEVLDCEQSCGFFPGVDGCANGECTSCPTSCTQSSECDDGATCSDGVCVPGASGVLCSGNSDCPSANCRLSPDGSKRCTLHGAECADGRGGGLGVSETTCHDNDLYTCQAGGDFAAPKDCLTVCGLFADVDQCDGSSCHECPTSCVSDKDCKGEAWCDGTSVCVADLAVAQACQRDAMCKAANCRKAPDGTSLCVAVGGLCADPIGIPMAAGDKTCYEGDSYVCVGEDTFHAEDCADDCGSYLAVDDCTAGECGPCASSCNSDAECKAGLQCDENNQCVDTLPSGEECSDDSSCDSNNCRKAYDGKSYCTPVGMPCSDGQGGGLHAGEGTCHQNDWYHCADTDSVGTQDCASDCGPFPAVDSCGAAGCQPCATSCASNADCDPEAYCDAADHCEADEAVGDSCEENEDCLSANCRKAPDQQYYCTPAGDDCSDGEGGGLDSPQDNTCYDDNVHLCVAKDEFAVTDCRDTTCKDGACRCGNTICDMSESSGCDNDTCVCGSWQLCDGTHTCQPAACGPDMTCRESSSGYGCFCGEDGECSPGTADGCDGATCRCGSRSGCPGEQKCYEGTCMCWPGTTFFTTCMEHRSDGCREWGCSCGDMVPCVCGGSTICMTCKDGGCMCGHEKCWKSASNLWQADRCIIDMDDIELECSCGDVGHQCTSVQEICAGGQCL